MTLPDPHSHHWTDGYSASELEDAQARYGLVFPPDLVALLRERRPIQGYDWRADHDAIGDALRWPLEGLLFDVEQNQLWLDAWGVRAQTEAERRGIVEAAVRAAPPLIPLLSHRYLPAEPSEAGNPVFSVYQSDIIYYGADLTDYFQREFNGVSGAPPRPARLIRFWSDFAE